MGTFTHPITLHPANGGQPETLDALVDTGPTFTSVLAATMERLGVAPEGKVRLGLADGSIAEREISVVRAELDGFVMPTHCVFGDPDEPPVIGAVTLEVFLLAVDPVQQRLVPVIGYALKSR